MTSSDRGATLRRAVERLTPLTAARGCARACWTFSSSCAGHICLPKGPVVVVIEIYATLRQLVRNHARTVPGLSVSRSSGPRPRTCVILRYNCSESEKSAGNSFIQAVFGLRFLYTLTSPSHVARDHKPFGKRPRRLPTVLSVEEVDALLKCTPRF